MKINQARFGARRLAAFTLVELLVVIGIIALLISVLLPALNQARNAAKTTVCLSNIRQLSLACAMYTSQTGYTVPAWIYGKTPSKVKLTDTDVNGVTLHVPGDYYFQTWPTILYNARLINATVTSNMNEPPMTRGVFYCPMGAPDFLADGLLNETVGAGWTQGQWYRHDTLAGFGAGYRFFGRESATGPLQMIDSWYGINSSDQPPTGTQTITTSVNTPMWSNSPTRSMQDSGPAGTGQYLVRASSIRDSSKVAFLYDGVYVVPSRDAGRINGRHGKNRQYTNVGFVDGHAETINRFDMPWLATSPYGPSNQFSYPKCSDFPLVRFRTDGR